MDKYIQLFKEITSVKEWKDDSLNKILRKYKKEDGTLYRNDYLVNKYREYVSEGKIEKDKILEKRLRLRPTRTDSGVVVVTLLTKPYGCPGNCIYCPTEPLMPKSYIATEPGAQRALDNLFDPYAQVYNRLIALRNIGHNIEKVEIIILGGTWSFYPLDYQIWFVDQCYKALNSIDTNSKDYIKPRKINSYYEESSWEELEKDQVINESAYCRNVGLVLETRPDYITEENIIDMRRLGATKIQIGIQSLDDEVLNANKIGRSVKEVENAFALLRRAGFKIHGHVMPNLYKSTIEKDIATYKKLWTDPFCPDELKIYPTTVIRNTYLSYLYNRGMYKPYSADELVDILAKCMEMTPRYCRLSRIIRDIPSGNIEAGNKKTNLRQIVEERVKENGVKLEDIRSREIKEENVNKEDIVLEDIAYDTTVSVEHFLSYKTKSTDKLCGFLRLSLPKEEYRKESIIKELDGCAIIREVHVYGSVVGLENDGDGESQHIGLGKSLIKQAEKISKDKDFSKLAVISAIGTRKYYESQSFVRDNLYLIKKL
ncbi:tRNA uridine(34) 5-carboxymethylaminomethyl modification radical SAM/GNAT enzyme Elp3 [bacterium]|nr:tRNA uridine(34) 5-carboxymethylaminomethyl modification radical SAM/GNAT enzyme Elp3 [bacterium]